MSNETTAELLDLDIVRGEKARRSFKEFVKVFWSVVEPSTPFADGWHVDAVCEHLEGLKDGTVRNLVVNIPPRHGKSLLLTVFFPAWMWLHQPSHRFMCSSYSLQLSIRDSVKCRRLIESPLYQKCYGHLFQLTDDQNTKTKFENSERGYRLATSVGSANTGEGADTLLVDDANDVSTINSDTERRKVIVWWSSVMSTRMNDPSSGCRVLIQQRCHEEDLSGFVIANDKGDNWCKLILPLEFQGDRTPNKKGWADPRFAPGELLSKRIPEDEINFLKSSLGTSGFSAQYNQAPAPASGEFFRQDWFRYYEQSGDNYKLGGKLVSASSCWRFATVDLAISMKSTADYTVVAIFDVTQDGEIVLVHLHRARIEGTRIVPTLKALSQEYRPGFFGIEDVAFQRLILQQARQEGLCVRALKAQGDKISRSIPLQVKFEAGGVWFPKGKPYLMALELELLKFGPDCSHDDMCFVAGTLISTDVGPKPIEAMRVGDTVLTRLGCRRVIDAGMTNESAEVMTISLSDGTTLTGTANHPVWVEGRGFVVMDDLTYDDIVLCENQSNTTAILTTDTPSHPTGNTGYTSKIIASGRNPRSTSTGKSGQMPTARSRMDFTSTTETATRSTTLSTTSNVCRSSNTGAGTPNREITRVSPNTSNASDRSRQCGTEAERDASGIANMEEKIGKNGNPSRRPACNAASPTPRSSPHEQSIVRASVVSKHYETGGRPVYNLTVEDTHEYFANTILVHNCDCLSYAALECSKRHRNRPKEEEAPTKTWEQVYLEALHEGL